jgi:hypothetical protein
MTRLGLAFVPLIVSLLVASIALPAPAWAQTQPPAVSTDAPAAAPAPSAPAATPPPPAPAAPETAPLTAAPAPAAAPAPLLTAPAPTAEPGTLPPLPPPEERPPVYKQTWFWGVVAVAGLTAIMIAYGLGSQGPATPNTDLGNMRAF